MSETRINADFDELAHLQPEQHEWVASPSAGVERVRLDRVGDEVAVATSLVRYAEGSRFPAHAHAKGEEFVVLEGEFGDEHARYPAGTYVRNPSGTHHTPFSDPGCVIWVKLRQFHDDDQHQFSAPISYTTPDAGWERDELHRFKGEEVDVVRAASGAEVRIPASFYARELLVIEGRIRWQIDATLPFGKWGWLRVAPGHPLRIVAEEPSVMLIKTRVHFEGRP